MAFMFETRQVIRATRWAMETPLRQADYGQVWSGFTRAQVP
jgi:homogentisate 1,2-dioxygenase